jgi:predicted aldo/keto reductase-like oxidoreductase
MPRLAFKYDRKLLGLLSQCFYASLKELLQDACGDRRSVPEMIASLQTDCIDLWQLHNITEIKELDQIFSKDGAIEAMNKARDEEMVRFLGITGHFDSDVLIEGINRIEFDTILMSLNPSDPLDARE